jgi:hypothetical protein
LLPAGAGGNAFFRNNRCLERSAMTHDTTGGYAAKHPKGAEPDPRIVDVLKTKMKDGGVSCAAAHKTSEQLSVPPTAVGRTMDLLELRIVKCQMGLFGYSPVKKIVEPAEAVTPEIRAAVSAETMNGRLACRTAWDIADRLGITRLALAAACEAMAVKVSPCQIGAF